MFNASQNKEAAEAQEAKADEVLKPRESVVPRKMHENLRVVEREFDGLTTVVKGFVPKHHAREACLQLLARAKAQAIEALARGVT